jgi:hypothetical protein
MVIRNDKIPILCWTLLHVLFSSVRPQDIFLILTVSILLYIREQKEDYYFANIKLAPWPESASELYRPRDAPGRRS